MRSSWIQGTVPALAAVVVGWVLLDRLALPDEIALPEGGVLYRGRVVSAPAGSKPTADVLYVRPASGPHRGKSVPATWATIAAGDERIGKTVFVELPAAGVGIVRSFARDRLFLALSAGLLCLIVVIAGEAVWRLLVVLLAGIGCLVVILAPSLAAGLPPLAAGLLAGMTFIVAASLLIGRAGKLSLGILAGATGGVAVAASLALLAVTAGRLTGVYSSLTKDLWYNAATRELDFRQLLCAGMIVGACGIIVDLAAAVASAVHQVHQANPLFTRRQLAAAGMAVGRDVMGTELNTLIFAYAGAHVGVLLLPMLSTSLRGFEIPALRVFSQQAVAIDAFQMLVGTTALVLTIPITAAASALLLGRGRLLPEVVGLVRGRRRRVLWLAGGALLLAAWLGSLLWHGRAYHRYGSRPTDPPGSTRYIVQAEVKSAEPPPEALRGNSPGERVQKLTCRLRSGPGAGQTVQVLNSISGFPGHDKLVRPGDAVLLQSQSVDGAVTYATVLEFSRGRWLIDFSFVLLMAVLLVGGWQGLRATAALLLSGAILYPVVTGVGAGGWGALPSFLVALAPLCVGVFLILAGPTRKALAAGSGAFGGLLVGAGCALAAAAALGLTGLQSDSMMGIRMFTGAAGIDYLGLLQAGMVLGIIGVAMDVAIAIASAVDQVRRAKPTAARAELFRRGLAVGRTIMIPMTLVLVFAYIGLNLPILMLPRILPGHQLSLLVSNERVSVELLRILVGGIGVVATVPVTAAVAGGLASGKSKHVQPTSKNDRGRPAGG